MSRKSLQAWLYTFVILLVGSYLHTVITELQHYVIIDKPSLRDLLGSIVQGLPIILIVTTPTILLTSIFRKPYWGTVLGFILAFMMYAGANDQAPSPLNLVVLLIECATVFTISVALSKRNRSHHSQEVSQSIQQKN